jgi:hypothetical protein
VLGGADADAAALLRAAGSPRASAAAPDWAWLPAATVPEWEAALGGGSRARATSSGAGTPTGAAGLSLGSPCAQDGGDGAPWPLRLRIVQEWRPPGGGARPPRPLRLLLASPDESFAVSVAGTIRVWDLAALSCAAEYAQHRAAPTAAALLPGHLCGDAAAARAELHSALVLSGDAAGALHVWRAASGERLACMQEPFGGAFAGAPAFASALPASVMSASPPAAPPAMAHSPGASASQALQAAAAQAQATASPPAEDCGVSCVRALDGGWNGRAVAGLLDGRLRFADVATARLLHAWRVAPAGSEAGGAPAVRSLALSPGSAAGGAGEGTAFVAAGLSSGALTLLDARAGGVVSPFC